MASSELIVLDVGHGNCAIIRHEDEVIVVDAPSKPVVAQTLDELGIQRIRALIISHADSDHLSGSIPLLMDQARPVQDVYVNPDPRKGKAWREFRQAAGVARKRGAGLHATLDTNLSGAISLAQTTIRVLHPSPEMCLATVEGQDTDGRKLDANTMSAVIRIDHDGETVCLLAADASRHSLTSMLDDKVDLAAPILIFPHHGGRSGGGLQDNRAFAKELVSSVQPQLVLFSLGRGVHNTPRPEIIEGVREGLAEGAPYIACTQLSTRCAAALPVYVERGLDPHSEGLNKHACCAGTITFPLGAESVSDLVRRLSQQHGRFVARDVPNPLCMRVLQAN